MKSFLIVTSFILLVVAFTAPASAEVICGQYSGASAFGSDGMTWCGGYGDICSNCYDTDSRASCSANADRCNPNGPPPPPVFQASLCATPKPASARQIASENLKTGVSSLKADQLL